MLAQGKLTRKAPILAFEVHGPDSRFENSTVQAARPLVASFSTSSRIMGPHAPRTLMQQEADLQLKGMAFPISGSYPGLGVLASTTEASRTAG